MSDLLTRLNRNPLTGWLAKRAGLPDPVPFRRATGSYVERPLGGKTAQLFASGGFAFEALRKTVVDAGAELWQASDERSIGLVVMDATGLSAVSDLRKLYYAFHPIARRIRKNGRVLLMARPVEDAASPASAAAARGVEGFCRSLGKELGRFGTTANLAYVDADAVDRLDGVVRFFCGPQSAYVSGQAVTVTADVASPADVPVVDVLAGKVALVTGGARGIGLASARRLAQEGAQVVCLDVPAMSDELSAVCEELGATPLALDVTAEDAPRRLARILDEQFGGVDVVVHNAGVTRDRAIANLRESYWDLVLRVNLEAIVAIDEALMKGGVLHDGVLRDGGRIVCMSSISGVAGNAGQTNYATTKAALIGYVAAQAPRLADRGITVNAIAPGFIETAMTNAMPFAMREVGRRLNSLKQGGLPEDVGETVCFLASPGAYGVTGQTLRVCGQAMIGA